MPQKTLLFQDLREPWNFICILFCVASFFFPFVKIICSELHCVLDLIRIDFGFLSVAAGVSNDHDLHSSLSYTTKNRNRQEKMAGK